MDHLIELEMTLDVIEWLKTILYVIRSHLRSFRIIIFMTDTTYLSLCNGQIIPTDSWYPDYSSMHSSLPLWSQILFGKAHKWKTYQWYSHASRTQCKFSHYYQKSHTYLLIAVTITIRESWILMEQSIVFGLQVLGRYFSVVLIITNKIWKYCESNISKN